MAEVVEGRYSPYIAECSANRQWLLFARDSGLTVAGTVIETNSLNVVHARRA